MDDLSDDKLLRRIDGHNKRELEKPCTSLADMLERVEYYALTGNMEKSHEWLLTAKESAKSNQERSGVLIMMAKYGQDHATASLCYEEASALLDDAHEGDKGMLIFNAGLEAFYARDFDRAVHLLQQAAGLLSSDTDNRTFFLICLGTLGHCFFAKGEYEKAIEVLAALSERYREADSLSEYHDTRCHIATSLKYLKRYDEAVRLLQEALDYYDSEGLHLNFLSAKAELESCLAHAGLPLSSDNSFKEKNGLQARRILESELAGLENTRKYLGKDMYARSLGIISGTYRMLGERENALKYARQYIDALRDDVTLHFGFSRFSDRALFWEAHKDYIRQIKALFSGQDPVSGEPAALLYDIALLEKGILLCSSIELQRVIHESGSAYLEDLYTRACRYEAIRKERPLTPAESLSYEAVSMELMNGCAELRDYTTYLNCRWQDVKSRLMDGDIAIEFITCPGETPADSGVLFAAIIRSGDKTPAAVSVCDSQLISLLIGMADTGKPGNTTEYCSFWGRFTDWLGKNKRVFFSPDGPLCYYGIEYLKGPDGSLGDRYEVHRISSTREIWRQMKLLPIRSAALFGGASYPVGEYVDLYHSMDEVIDIRSLLLESGVTDVSLYTKKKVTKDALVALSGKAPSCIHLAVHGDYTPSAEHPDGMKDSFLVLAGGETVTAEEIAGMDLHGCELVVLSCCYGSRGELLDDGVFGLQRAFKNAGVKALLMSTGPIEDEVSANLMKTFYGGLMSGQTCHEALETARRAINDSFFYSRKMIHRFILLEF